MIGMMGDMETGEYVKNKTITHCKATAFVLEPGKCVNAKGSPEGIIAIDGEKVDYATAYVQSFRGLLNIICGHE